VAVPAAAGADPTALPETAGQIAEYRLLFSASGQEGLVDSLVSADGSAARLSARIRTMTTADHLRLIAAIERFAAQNLDSRLVLHATGMVKVFAGELHALIRSLLLSFGLSFVLIAGLMAIQLRSVRAGLCAMIPNVLPIALGLGLMGYLSIPLSASTVMIASVGIGISVDDTIHFLLRYRRELVAGRSSASAARRTLLGTGRAMVYSSLGLAAGFSILSFSSFRPNREFGILTAFIMVAALLADLFATPYLVRALHLFRREHP
jgi:predicted RND superfamily exporter protein